MRTNRLALVPFVLSGVLGVVVACGGSTSGGGPGGSGSVSGTVSGTSLSVASELAGFGTSTSTRGCTVLPDGGDPTCPSTFTQSVSVVFTNRSDASCAAIQNELATNTDVEYANLVALDVSVSVASGNVVAGTYQVVGPSQSNVTGASATFETTTSTCGDGLGVTATSGTVTLTQVSSASVTGTYSVTFGTQGTLSGSFDVGICAVDAGTVSSPPKPVCKP